MSASKKELELRIVFDTNSIYTGSEVYFLNKDTFDLINELSSIKDIQINWFCPDVVRHERQFQMQERALKLLPNIKKMEKILGHNLNITDKIVLTRVEEAIDEQMNNSKINRLDLNMSLIDWGSVIQKACYREPPFEKGEKEKGFRDAVIVETFCQLIENSPKTRKVCRIIMLTEDSLLACAVKKRTVGIRNVQVVETIEELKGLINTLASTVEEEYIGKINTTAKLFFFEENSEDGLYYKAKISGRIKEKFRDFLVETPESGSMRENENWLISAPIFVKKVKQKVFWSTKILVESKIYKWTESGFVNQPWWVSAGAVNWGGITANQIPLPVALNIAQPAAATYPVAWNIAQPAAANPPSGFYVTSDMEDTKKVKALVNTGKTVFEVLWSVTVTTILNFLNPNIEEIKASETRWEI